MSDAHRTSDLVTRLRKAAKEVHTVPNSAGRLFADAADCIEQLQMPHADVLRLAEREDGADGLALVNALARKVEAQKREIERLHAKADRLIALAMERGARS